MIFLPSDTPFPPKQISDLTSLIRYQTMIPGKRPFSHIWGTLHHFPCTPVTTNLKIAVNTGGIDQHWKLLYHGWQQFGRFVRAPSTHRVHVWFVTAGWHRSPGGTKTPLSTLLLNAAQGTVPPCPRGSQEAGGEMQPLHWVDGFQKGLFATKDL